jgi:SPP1 gp7 family putative phage head morphogenesis protein
VKYNLPAMYRRARNPRRRQVVLRPVTIPATLASDLYASVYAGIVKVWEAALPAITEQYERTLAEMTTDSPEENGSTISAVENEVSRILVTVRLRLEAWAARVERLHRQKWRGAVLSGTGVDINTMIGPGDVRQTLGAVIEENVALVRSVSDQARQRIAAEVFDGLRARRPARETARVLREKVAMSRRRALNIASDQASKLGARLNVERAQEAGLEQYEWVHSGKVHPRPEHKARNGKRYEYGKPAGDEPGFAIHCGCTARAVLSLDGEF